MWQGQRFNHPLIISLLMAISLWGCGVIETRPFKPRPIFMIGLDVSTTIGPTHFATMRDTMIPRIVLARLRPGDEVQWMPLHADPEQAIHIKPLTGKAGAHDEMQGLAVQMRQMEQLKDTKIANNTGGFLGYAKRISAMLDTAQQQRMERQGKSQSRTERIIVHLFTDGELPAGQGLPQPGPWTSNIEVWVWGVEREYETRLTQWLHTTLGLPTHQVHVVRFSDWQTVADQVFGPHIGRSFVDVAMLKRLGVY